MRITTRITTILLLVITALTACKSDYETTKSNSPIKIPDNLPPVSYSAKRVKVYSDSLVFRETYDAIDRGIGTQILTTTVDIPTLQPPDIWKQWKKGTNPSEYRVMLIDPTYFSQDPNYLGCPLLTMNDGLTVAGTVVGIRGSKLNTDYAFIVVAKPYTTRAECMKLFTDAVRYESEHWRLTNSPQLFHYYQGALDIHPIFKLEGE